MTLVVDREHHRWVRERARNTSRATPRGKNHPAPLNVQDWPRFHRIGDGRDSVRERYRLFRSYWISG